MKKSLLLIYIFVPLSLFSQINVYHPFPDSNAAWSVGSGYLAGNTAVQCHQWDWIKGDTIINSISYHKLYRYKVCSGGGAPVPFYNGYCGALRQDVSQKKVYYLQKSFNTEQLLYDFNLFLGDTLPTTVNNGNNNRVVFVDSIFIDTDYRKRFWLGPLGQTTIYDSAYSSIIEGIGTTQGLTESMYVPFESGSSLECFWQDGKTLYPDSAWSCPFATGMNEMQDKQIQIYISPNPSTGIFTINSTEKFQYTVYDIFGREVLQSVNSPAQSITLDLSNQHKGVYFVRGKAGDKMFARKIILK